MKYLTSAFTALLFFRGKHGLSLKNGYKTPYPKISLLKTQADFWGLFSLL